MDLKTLAIGMLAGITITTIIFTIDRIIEIIAKK